MTAKISGALRAAQSWLDRHSRSKHTRRKYEAQLQQLCEWLLVRNLDLLSVESDHLKQYLKELGRGRLQLSDNPPKARLAKTVELTCSVLRSLFRELVCSGLRHSNPCDQLGLGYFHKAVVGERKTNQAANDWPYHRQLLSQTVVPTNADQIAYLRAVVIVELAYWVGLRRSEIASASMGDLFAKGSAWTIKVKKFGVREVDLVQVPQPAMQAIIQYRVARQLDAEPKAIEIAVPLIARLKSEKFVDPWTIANALRVLYKSTYEASTAKKQPSIVALRRELINRSLAAAVPAGSLSKHVRSEYAVRQIERSLPNFLLTDTLTQAAA